MTYFRLQLSENTKVAQERYKQLVNGVHNFETGSEYAESLLNKVK